MFLLLGKSWITNCLVACLVQPILHDSQMTTRSRNWSANFFLGNSSTYIPCESSWQFSQLTLVVFQSKNRYSIDLGIVSNKMWCETAYLKYLQLKPPNIQPWYLKRYITYLKMTWSTWKKTRSPVNYSTEKSSQIATNGGRSLTILENRSVNLLYPSLTSQPGKKSCANSYLEWYFEYKLPIPKNHRSRVPAIPWTARKPPAATTRTPWDKWHFVKRSRICPSSLEADTSDLTGTNGLWNLWILFENGGTLKWKGKSSSKTSILGGSKS